MPPPDTLPSPPPNAAPRRQLTLFDSTSIIVGIVIGSTIYESTPLIANQVPGVAWLLTAWVLGAILSLVGALCYAELAGRCPSEGGDYLYLSEAFGRPTGFVFAWMQFWIVRPGAVGTLAYVFARYAYKLLPLGEEHPALVIYAVGAIVVMSGINLLGVTTGKWTQNLLALVKFLGLVAVVAIGMSVTAIAVPAVPSHDPPTLNLGFAMIFILYAYSGWNEMAYVGSEVIEPDRNILRALLLGTLSVSVVYIALNAAFVHALGFEGVCNSKAVAADLLTLSVGSAAAKAISLLICISALGAINGMIFTGARIFYAMGVHHTIFAWMGHWSGRRDAPTRPIIIQAVLTVALAIGFGMTDRGFEASIAFSGPAFWGFLFLVSVALFVLRNRPAASQKIYCVPLYPAFPLVFCFSSAFMFSKSLDYAAATTPSGLIASAVLLIVGMALSRNGRT